MRKFFVLILLLSCMTSHALENKTFVFFINGDWYYKGPQFEETGVRLEDQANILYKQILKRAKEDKKNNYVLFYDPKGKGNILNRKWVKFRIFERGKGRYSHLLKDAEIDTTKDSFIELFSRTIKKKLGALKKDSSVFYYYGEHFPAHKEYRLDLSGDQNSKYGLKKLLRLMAKLGGFHTSIFHTCYVNALDFVGPLLDLSNEVIVPKSAILNTPLKMENAFSQNYLVNFSDTLVQENSDHERYKLFRYGQDAKYLFQKIVQLNSYVEPLVWQNMLNHFHKKDETDVKELGSEAFILRDWFDQKEKEIFLPFYDYLNLIDRNLLRGEENLDRIDQMIDKNPSLLELFILLPEPLS